MGHMALIRGEQKYIRGFVRERDRLEDLCIQTGKIFIRLTKLYCTCKEFLYTAIHMNNHTCHQHDLFFSTRYISINLHTFFDVILTLHRC